MTDFLQLFFSGLATGSIYALAALGFTLLWQASGTINFAQGEFVMLPAFMLLGFFTGLGCVAIAEWWRMRMARRRIAEINKQYDREFIKHMKSL